MKKFILLLGLLVATVTYNKADAQNINISINIGSQPAWGPVGYDYVDYYYIPEIDVYYNVNSSLFYYWLNGYWMSARYLPYRYHSYDFYNMYKVVVNVHDPWMYNKRHRRLYSNYRSYKHQPVIKHSNDSRYSASRRNEVRWTASNSRTTVKETRVSNSANSRSNRNANISRVRTNQSTVNKSDNNNRATRPATTTQTSRVNNNSQSSRVNNNSTQNRSSSSSQTSRPARTTSVSNSSQSGRTSSGNSTRVSSSSRSSSNNGSAVRSSSSNARSSRR